MGSELDKENKVFEEAEKTEGKPPVFNFFMLVAVIALAAAAVSIAESYFQFKIEQTKVQCK